MLFNIQKNHIHNTHNLAMNLWFTLRKIGVLCLITALISGCEVPKTENIAPQHKQHTISIRTWNNINSKLGLSIDLVQVYDKDTFATLQTMDAKTFNQKKQQMQMDNPSGFNVWSIDFIDNDIKSFHFPAHRNFWGIVIFLHFINSTQNRIILPANKHDIVLEIADGNFRIATKHRGEHHHYVELQEGDKYNVTPFGNSL